MEQLPEATRRSRSRSGRPVLQQALLALGKSATHGGLPPETATLKQTSDPGYARTDAFCAICHSRDYITTQPPGKGKEFWAAEVTKMVNVYAAPIPEPDRAVIADYLAANY